jgi:hypothetical protein
MIADSEDNIDLGKVYNHLPAVENEHDNEANDLFKLVLMPFLLEELNTCHSYGSAPDNCLYNSKLHVETLSFRKILIILASNLVNLLGRNYGIQDNSNNISNKYGKSSCLQRCIL